MSASHSALQLDAYRDFELGWVAGQVNHFDAPSSKSSVTFKRVGMATLLFMKPFFPAMAIFLKGISIGLKAGG
jgi:hypothetical protein